jgi:hypothetical protein
MQKSFKPVCLILFCFFCACHNNTETRQKVQQTDTEDVQTFFPVTQFIEGQLNEIDSLPVTPLKITIEGDKRDSAWLKNRDIRAFAISFLHPVIDSSTMHTYFSEKTFMDQTINAVTLTYDPKVKLPDSIKLNHLDVYIDPGKNIVQRIYMVKEEIANDETITTQLTWMANKWCSIRTIKQQPKAAPDVKEEIVKWNLDD